MFDEQPLVQRLKFHSSELQPSEMEILWSIVTKILPEHRKFLRVCYLEIIKETYERAGIQIAE